MSEQEIEQKIQDKGLNAPRLTPSLIDSVIVGAEYHVFPGTTLTVCCLTLRNGFTVTGESAAASPDNFDFEIGKEIAIKNAREKIWALEGYLLRDKISRDSYLPSIARVCHEVNRAYCLALGDTSQPAWEEAPQWQRESALLGVQLHTSGDHGPQASHESWMKQKLEDGWKYGEVKDPELKTHPCLVPFDELPESQQAKDYIFRAVVHALK